TCHRKMDVGIQERKAHLANGIRNIFLRQRLLLAKTRKQLLELLCESCEHKGAVYLRQGVFFKEKEPVVAGPVPLEGCPRPKRSRKNFAYSRSLRCTDLEKHSGRGVFGQGKGQPLVKFGALRAGYESLFGFKVFDRRVCVSKLCFREVGWV